MADDKAIAAIVEECSSKYLADSSASNVDIPKALVVPKVKFSPSEFQPQPTNIDTSPDLKMLIKNANLELSLELDHQKALVQHLEARLSDSEDKNSRTIAERDFFRAKLAESNPYEYNVINGSSGGEGFESSVRVMETYVKEIESLKAQLLVATLKPTTSTDEFDEEEAILEGNLTSSIARIIQQTKASLIEEQEKVRNILAAESIPVDDDPGDDNSTEPLKSVDVEDERNETQERRQKILTAEVIELSQSIKLKEQLLEQLLRSQHQYAAMKKFYEERLTELNHDLEAKESEREKLLVDIETLVNKPVGSKDRETELRNELKRRDQELVELRKSKKELSNLSNVQARVNEQMNKLQNEIKEMKSQRVELSKVMQTEKKNHLQELNSKLREIERLKRELSKSSIEMKKMNVINERNEVKLKKVLSDTITLRKKNMELQKTAAFREPPPPTLNSVRQSARYVMTTAARTLGKVFSSSSEAKTKSWLDSRITKISSRELELKDVQKQCHQQLVTVNRRESLEQKKRMLHAAVGTDDAQALPTDEADVLIDVEERIDGLDTELQLRGESIASMEKKLLQRSFKGKEETFDAIRKTAANTLPGAQLLIKLLFDMMVESRKKIIELQESNAISLKQIQELRREHEDSEVRYRSLQRSHDMELSRVMRDYEEKLAGLFNYSNAGRLLNLEPIPEDAGISAPRAIISSPVSRNSVRLSQRMSIGDLKTTVNASLQSLEVLHLGKQESSADANAEETELMGQLMNMKTLLKVSSEQVKSLKHQVDIDSYQLSVFRGQLEEILTTKGKLEQELADKALFIKFLEDELKMFREKVEEYKAQLPCSPRISPTSSFNKQFHRDDDDDDSVDLEEEIEFQKLAEEIHRAGISKGYGLKENKTSVHERLSDPSHYTGSIREVFKEDIAEKRRIVAQVKESKIPKEVKHEDGLRVSAPTEQESAEVFVRLTGRAKTAAEKLREIRANPEAPTTDAWAKSNYASLEDRSLVKPRLITPKHGARGMMSSPPKTFSEKSSSTRVKETPAPDIEAADVLSTDET